MTGVLSEERKGRAGEEGEGSGRRGLNISLSGSLYSLVDVVT